MATKYIYFVSFALTVGIRHVFCVKNVEAVFNEPITRLDQLKGLEEQFSRHFKEQFPTIISYSLLRTEECS